MNICIYQVNMARDDNNYKFMSLDRIERFTGHPELEASCYDKVYEGTVDCKNLEDVFKMFNLRHPLDFYGHSLSVSDVVEVKGPPADKGFYFCDSIGFKKIKFNPSLTQPFKGPETIRVLIVEPEKAPYAIQLASDLRFMQRVVSGNIESLFPSPDDNIAIICNEEGKLKGLPFNRSICDETGMELDYLSGTFFIAGVGEDDFCSLTDEQANRYSELFKDPLAPVCFKSSAPNLDEVIKNCEEKRTEPPDKGESISRDSRDL